MENWREEGAEETGNEGRRKGLGLLGAGVKLVDLGSILCSEFLFVCFLG